MEAHHRGWTEEENEENRRLFLAAFSREPQLKKDLDEISREPSEKGRGYMIRSLMEAWAPLSAEEAAMLEAAVEMGKAKERALAEAKARESSTPSSATEL